MHSDGIGTGCRRCDGSVATQLIVRRFQCTTDSTAALTSFVRQCFETVEELQRALDLFVLQVGREAVVDDNGPMPHLSATYGLPIGTWCVSRSASFSNLFDSDGLL
jgi:hypothetical protein